MKIRTFTLFEIIIMLFIFCIIFPSCEKAEELPVIQNMLGNTSGNIVNGGGMAIQDDWIYYNSDGLCKIKTDGTEKQKLSDKSVGSINILDDTIYYICWSLGGVNNNSYSINSIKTDGSNKLNLSGELASYLNVTNDRLYYINYGDNKIYSMKFDGSDVQKHNNEYTIWLNVIGDYIYYQTYVSIVGKSINYTLYSMKIDGSNKKELCDEYIASINIIDNKIYYGLSYYGGIYSMNLDGTDVKKIYDDKAYKINVFGGRIYYVTWEDFKKDEKSGGINHIICSIKIDGSDKKKLSEDYQMTYDENKYSIDDNPYNLLVVNDRIYFYNREEERFCSIKLDGSDKKDVDW